MVVVLVGGGGVMQNERMDKKELAADDNGADARLGVCLLEMWKPQPVPPVSPTLLLPAGALPPLPCLALHPSFLPPAQPPTFAILSFASPPSLVDQFPWLIIVSNIFGLLFQASLQISTNWML